MMMHKFLFSVNLFVRCIVFSSVAIFFATCAPSRFVKPLKKNQQAIQASFGGPTIKFGKAIIPVPFTTVAYARGITDKLTAFGGLHTTSLLFSNLQTDLGITADAFKIVPRVYCVVSPAIQVAYNLRNKTGFKVWPSIDINLRYDQNKGYVYLGAMSWIELSKTKAFNEPQKRRAIPNLQFGYCKTNTKWHHTFELKYLGLGVPTKPGIVDYIGINKKGSFGLYYGLTYLF
jgi:hypothetical protein